MTALTEADVETTALSGLSRLGCQTAYRRNIAPEDECSDFGQGVLEDRLREALFKPDPTIPAPAREHVRGGENGARVYHFSGPVTHFQRLLDSGPEARCLARMSFVAGRGPQSFPTGQQKTKEIWDGPG